MRCICSKQPVLTTCADGPYLDGCRNSLCSRIGTSSSRLNCYIHEVNAVPAGLLLSGMQARVRARRALLATSLCAVCSTAIEVVPLSEWHFGESTFYGGMQTLSSSRIHLREEPIQRCYLCQAAADSLKGMYGCVQVLQTTWWASGFYRRLP